MPQVNGQQFPYTPEGYQDAQQAQMATGGTPGLGGQMPMFGNTGMSRQMPMFGGTGMDQQMPMFGNTSVGIKQRPMGGQQMTGNMYENPPGVPDEYIPYEPGGPYYLLPNDDGPPGFYKREGPGMVPVDPVHFNKPKPDWVEELIDKEVGGSGVIGTQLYNLFNTNPMLFYNLLELVNPDAADRLRQQIQQGTRKIKETVEPYIPSMNPLDWFKR